MFNGLSLEKAHLLNKKLEEIKNTLDQEIISHSSNEINVEISVLGNIKKISNPLNKNLEEIISIINESIVIARQEYEVKQAHLLQKEMMNLI